MSVQKHASIATIAVFGSRIMGLVREVVFAFFFGAGPILDAFLAAFRIPNLLRDLFSEGALSSAFVTVFSKKIEKEGDRPAWILANRVFGFIILLVGLISLLGIVFSPLIVKIVASGFEGDKYAYTVFLTRLLFPFILFVSLAAVAMGMLNTKHKFFLPQSASTFFNVSSIFIGLTAAFLLAPEWFKMTLSAIWEGQPMPNHSWDTLQKAMTGMALGTLCGGFIQWFIQMPSLKHLGFKFRPLFNLKDSSLIQVLKLTGPAVLGGAAVQVNVLVNTNFASYLEDGSISWLAFAFRLMQFPIGVFGVAIALATTPEIARLVAKKDTAAYRMTLQNSIRMSLFLCLPSALGLIVLAEPIMSLIYEYGQFTSQDTLQAAYALKAYAIGLCFYALIKIYQPAFLSFDDAKTPMLISFSSICINFIVNWILVFKLNFSHWGLAMGTSFVAIWNFLLLALLIRQKIDQVWKYSLFKDLLKIVFISALSLSMTYLLTTYLRSYLSLESFLNRLILVFVPLSTTVILYFILAHFFKVQEAQSLLSWIKSKISRA